MNTQSSVLSPQHSVPILAVIMARAGSIGLPQKSLRLLHGKPVLTYTLNHAKESKLITRTIVSSDSPEILSLAKSENFETLQRPPELATPTSPTDPVLRHALRTLYPQATTNKTTENTENTEKNSEISNLKSPPSSVPSVSSVVKSVLPHAVVMLYGNVPIRAANMIDRCIQMLIDTNADSVQTIAPVGKFHPYWMFDYTPDTSQIQKHIPNNIFRRQDLPPLYSPTGAVYVIKTSILLASEGSADPHAFLGTDRRALLTTPEDSVDIDTEKDLHLAESLLRSHP